MLKELNNAMEYIEVHLEDEFLLDFSTMLVFWSLFSLVRNSVVLAVYLLFSVTCFFTIHEHWHMERNISPVSLAFVADKV